MARRGTRPVLGAAWGLVRETSLYRGDVAHDWIRSELKNLGVTSFGDLPSTRNSYPRNGATRLVVTVADLTAAQLVRLPWDYRRLYGLDPDEQPVAEAVRASMAIPFFYRPVKLTGASGATSTLVDGGVLSNFPIDTFDRPDGKRHAGPRSASPSAEAHRGHRCGDAGAETAAFFRTDGIAGKPAHHDAGRPRPDLPESAVGRCPRDPVESTDVGVLDFDAPKQRLEELYDAATRPRSDSCPPGTGRRTSTVPAERSHPDSHRRRYKPEFGFYAVDSGADAP